MSRCLPEAPAPATADAAHKAETARRGSGEVILLVEDEPDLLVLGARLFRKYGYTVIQASSGATALEAAREAQRIDLLLSDIVMPGGMGGRQLAKDLHTTRPMVPVLLHEWLLRRCRRRERRRRRGAGHREAVRSRATSDGRANGNARDDARWLCHRSTRARRGGARIGKHSRCCARLHAATDANADVVFVVPGNRRTRTDSIGRFAFDSLERGRYIVRARRVGYGPAEWSIDCLQIRSRRRADSARIEDHTARHCVFH